jgi:peptidoglycan/xylan/chitin deacetylase (PgdA/CDA1 family)
VQWDVISGDSFLTDPSQVVREVLSQVRPGSIVVMHLIGAPKAPATAAALQRIVPALRARHFRFVTVWTLLHQAS